MKKLPYSSRIRLYNQEKNDWIRNHPDATSKEIEDKIKELVRKYRV